MLDQLLAVLPPKYLVAAMAFCGVCAALDAWMPPTPATSRWAPLRKLISLAGQNYRNATNATPTTK